jgi:hypothetical protein
MAAIVSNSLMPVHEANPHVQKLRGRSISSQNVQLAFASAVTVLLVTAGLAYRSSVGLQRRDYAPRQSGSCRLGQVISTGSRTAGLSSDAINGGAAARTRRAASARGATELTDQVISEIVTSSSGRSVRGYERSV